MVGLMTSDLMLESTYA